MAPDAKGSQPLLNGVNRCNSKGEQPTKDGLRPNPEQSCNFFMRITFLYMIPFLRRGFSKSLEVEDMYQPLPQHDSEAATKRLGDAWEHEKKLASSLNRPASLFSAIWRSYWKDIVKFGILLFIEECIHVTQPLFMGRLIRYFRFEKPLSDQEAYIAATGVAATAAITAFIHHPYFFGLQKVGLQIKIAASGLIVQKGVRLSSAAIQKATVGHMVNLLSTDISKFDMGFIFFHYIWVSPIMLAVYIYLLWQEIGVSCLAGFGALVILIPIQGYFSRQMGKTRREIAQRSDKRISVMNEILNGIRVIKMYAWEGAFAQVIAKLRKEEMKKVRANAVYQSLVMGLFWSSGKLIVLFAALSYVLLGNDLTAERIFVATALYNSCRLPISLFLPFSLQFFAEMRVSVRRIQAFLELEEFNRLGNGEKPKNDNNTASINFVKANGEEETPLTSALDEKSAPETSVKINSTSDPNGAHVRMNNFTTSWSTSEEEGEDILAIKNITFSANRGQLTAVVGPVGSGKSSLLYSLLGETRPVSGSLSMSGRVAYCSQDAWIFSGTVRENVVFGEDFDEEKYRTALEVSALNNDVNQFPQGDQTLVGERGTSLSGGQKARVALARAIYADADIYLLDDPLSAVDAAVGRFLFEKCVSGHLKQKVTILVTHQVQFLDTADNVLLMKSGEIIAAAPLAELKVTHSEQFAQLIEETERTYARRISETTSPRSMDEEEELDLEEMTLERSTSVLSEKEQKLDLEHQKTEHVSSVEEERADGAVEWRIYWEYIKSMCGRVWTVIPMIIFVLLVQLFFNLTDYWLNKWTNASERSMFLAHQGRNFTGDNYEVFGYSINLTLDDYRNMFIAFTLILVVSSVIRCVWFRMLQTIASIILHSKMCAAVMNTHITFFDKNPIGRILNRFSKDVGTMDDQLSFVFFEFIMGALNVFGLVAVIIMLNRIVFLPTLPLSLVFVFLRIVYLSSSRDVKRLEATSRSPLYSHISATMHGLITVRAFARQDDVMKRYHHTQNLNTAAFSLTIATSRWFAVSIDWIVALFVSVVAFFCVLGPRDKDSGEVALMLVYAVQLTGFFSWIMRQSAELQNGMVSVERVVHYTELESEHKDELTTTIPPDNWPLNGHIKMNNIFLKYTPDSDYVLKNITLDIKSQEKIGIVGRTGAGKSSLLRAIFRLTVPSSGSIYIDDVDTATIPLKKLRKSLAIIPQEPVLFIGSLRRNLDPFDEYPDDEIWDSLEQVELKSVVAELPGGLDASMQEGGANFSVGQRQLVCLARALLRHAKVLVIDEATANVDPKTDALIQKTLRARFANSTVLTIAHRLHTIMDSTRVLVLKDGEVAEFDAPYNLLKDDHGILTSLVNETGSAHARVLRKIASDAYANNVGLHPIEDDE